MRSPWLQVAGLAGLLADVDAAPDGTLDVGAFDGFIRRIDVDPDPNSTSLVDRIQKYDGDGNLPLQWGTYGTGVGRFHSLLDVVVGPSRHTANGDLFVSDRARDRVPTWRMP